MRLIVPSRPVTHAKPHAYRSWGYRKDVHDEPIDPFAGDPADPSAELDQSGADDPLTAAERQQSPQDVHGARDHQHRNHQ